jgi:diguanylate cyclase (GGDEF)-like protein
MDKRELLPNILLEKLQSTYEHFPRKDEVQEEENEFDSGLKEFLAAYGQDILLEAGETLFYEGDVADGLYWIESGVVAILQGDMDKPRLLTFRTTEHVVGEIALLENIKRTASVAAITETKMKYLSQDKFKGLLSLVPGFGVELMRLLSARLRETKPAEYSDGMYDHLTGAMSRQAFDLRLQEEIERAQIYRYTFSLVFLDLDHFKEVNDNYGHARGDQVLVEFARRIMDDLRTTDTLFRYGGDEFVLLLQGIDEKRGPGFVQRLLESSINSPIGKNPPITISFSAGISYFPEDGTLLEELLKAADERVYFAKAQGRGRVAANLDE